MPIAMQGLKPKPTYEDLINVAVSDGLENVQFPNRNAKFIRGICNVTIGWRRYEDYGKTTRNGK